MKAFSKFVNRSGHLQLIDILTSLLLCVLLACGTVLSAGGWGTPLKPFSADSLWNSRPVNPILNDTVTVPPSSYYPVVGSGTLSTGVFVATSTDGPKYVYGLNLNDGVSNVDSGGKLPNILIPRWPPSTLPATGDDGHCEIYDPIDNIIHSFWQMRFINGTVRANLYAWARLDGTGWGEPANYYIGARAAAVPTSAGLIRKHEVDDGDTMYRHVLTASLTFNGLGYNPTYIFPATAADINAATTNTGLIPEGALLMLPATFDVSKLSTPKLRKVAETLKVYGMRVVDRNTGTPYAIFVEFGANFTLHANNVWDPKAAEDLVTIREALRPLASCSGWLNGDDQPLTINQNLNLLSMRGGGWLLQSGPAIGVYNTWKQAIVFPANAAKVTQTNSNGVGFSKVSWAKPRAGMKYNVTAITTGGGQFRISFNLDCADTGKIMGSPILNNGESYVFTWPASLCWNTIYAISGINQESTVSVQMLLVESAPVATPSTVTPKTSSVSNSTSNTPNQPKPSSTFKINRALSEGKMNVFSSGLILLLSLIVLIMVQ